MSCFILACFAFIACYYGALSAKHPLILCATGLGVMMLFIIGYYRRRKRQEADQKMMELFREYNLKRKRQ